MKLKSKKIVLAFLTFVVLLSSFIWFDGFIKTKGFSGTFHFISVYFRNSFDAQKPAIKLELIVSDSSFKKLKKYRKEALGRGYIELDEDAFVPGQLIYKGKTLKCKIRLKGKMLDHVSGDKWSYRVKLDKNESFLGMRKFSLQHPGTRNYIYDWIYHQISGKEGIIKLNYQFVNLTFNGDDLGVYALEENFASELLYSNHRQNGPIFRFDPSAFWDFRLHEMKGINLNDEQSKFTSSHLDAYNESSVFKDSAIASMLDRAYLSIRLFLSGKIKASAAFDLKKFATRHAILDIIGGHKSVDWSDVKFYYNPETFLIEPIAYESFSANKIYSIIGEYRYLKDRTQFNDFHQFLFSDSEFFKLYITELNRMSKPGYIDSLLSSFKNELDENLSYLYHEFPYKEFDKTIYTHNLTVINEILSGEKLLHANSLNFHSGNLELKVTNLSSLPLEILGIRIKNQKFIFDSSRVLCAKEKNSIPDFIKINFDLKSNPEYSATDDAYLVYKILGNNKISESKIGNENILSDEVFFSNYLVNTKDAVTSDQFVVNEEKKIISPASKNLIIQESLRINEGYTLVVFSGTKISFAKNGILLVQGESKFLGSNENPISIEVLTDSLAGIVFLNQANIEFSNVRFIKNSTLSSNKFSHTAFLNAIHSNLNFNDCYFVDGKYSQLSFSNSTVRFSTCTVQNFSNMFCEADFSRIDFIECSLKNFTGKTFASATGSVISIRNSVAEQIKSTFLKMKMGGELIIDNSTFQGTGTFLDLKDGVSGRIFSSKWNDFKVLVKLKSKDEIFPPPSIEFFNSSLPEEKKYYDCDSKTRFMNNGSLFLKAYEK